MTTSQGQEYVRMALAILLGGAPFPTQRGVIGGSYELDGFNPNLKLAFEFQGQHHYDPTTFVHHGSDLERVQRTDRIKVERCEAVGIKLIVIPIELFYGERRRLCQHLVDEMDRLGMDPLEVRWTGGVGRIGQEAIVRPAWQKEIAIESRLSLFRFAIRKALETHPSGLSLPEFTGQLLKRRIRPRWTVIGSTIREIEFGWNGAAESSWTPGKKIGYAWSNLSTQGVHFAPENSAHLEVAQEFAYNKPRLVRG